MTEPNNTGNELAIIGNTDSTVVQSLANLTPSISSDSNKANVPILDLPTWEDANTHSLAKLAEPLLMVLAQLRRPQQNLDLVKLRHRLTLEINSFTVKSRNAKIPESKVLLARYIICAVVDEFILDTPWGANSNWSAQSMLNTFHQDSAGGEKFFAVLEKLQADPSTNLDLLIILFSCLSFGFVGRYRITQGGKEQLSKIRARLYQTIIAQQGEREMGFVTGFQPLNAKKVNEVKRIPVLKMVIAVTIILLVIYATFSKLLSQNTDKVIKDLHGVVVDNGVLTQQASRRNL